MTWLLLLGAIAAEVTGTIALRFSDGFSRLVPSLISLAGYGAALWLLAQVLNRGMNIGVAYGVWAALGVSLVAVVGAAFLGDSLTWVQAGGIVLVIAGVLALELGGAH
ncbi:multidrug efflux SMR transporter [Streptomonospora sp. PA3]|uniref:DMT family transporter n=1 Tax=Streptomonospora sp. PA3 TaxID=2607326 RepID=UPI0012DE0B5C|nr:multidrug efflux SMR transporter [Streptomonospora sp. PA3]MUL40987.1 multidrug efflux SMR transporter [Streptomonospora sp. PA3]